MEGVEPRTLIFLIGFGALSVLLLILVQSHDYRRRKGLAALAHDLGFVFEREAPQLLEQFEHFRSFPVGDNQRMTNVLSGDWGSATVWLLDYSYFTSGSLHQHSVCAVRSPDLKLPYFRLTRGGQIPGVEKLEAFLARTGIGSGSRDIDFPDDGEFSRNFRLDGREEDKVHRFFDRDLRQQLLRFAGKSATIEGNRDTLLLATLELVRPDAARELIRQGTDLLALLARRTVSSEDGGEAAASSHRIEPPHEVLAGTMARDGIRAEELRERTGVERKGRGSRAALKAVVLLLGIALAVAGGAVIYAEIQGTVAGRTEVLSNRLIVGIVLLVIGLGTAIQAAVGPALKRASIKRQLVSMRDIEAERDKDRTGKKNG